MDPIYVTGHRNPDSDSIVSAIAYAALRNALGDGEYIPARLGHLSDETKRILKRFDYPSPYYIHDMRTQVGDLDFDTPPSLNRAVTVNRGWNTLQKLTGIPSIPITNDDGTLFGMLSSSEVASYDISSLDTPAIHDIPLFNLISVLEGKMLNEACYNTDTISGELTIALPQSNPDLLFHSSDSIVIVGDQPDMIRRALDLKVACIVICQSSVTPEIAELAKEETATCMIASPFDAYKTVQLIYQAVPVADVCRTEGIVSFHLTDLLDNVRDVVLKNRHRSYPVLDENEKVVGTLSRYHLIRPRRKRVILVDHNESAQSVPGLEQAEILEILDHHRLADIQTLNPIYVRNEPVGSTATIVSEMYQEKGLVPPANLAGMICAAILSDTVMFKSPTCTDVDRRMAARMARIAGVSIEELGQTVFDSSGREKSAKELLTTDFKEFHIASHFFGVSQITTIDSASIRQREGEFRELMEAMRKEKGYSMMLLMITDVLLSGTYLICVGDTDSISQAFNADFKDGSAFLPGVLSRKKQIIPALSALWG